MIEKNKQKQLDIFGNEVDVIECYSLSPRSGKTIKSKFRYNYGYKKGFLCKNCKFFVECRYNRKYFKCEKMEITSSSATDIRKSDIACNLYEEENNE